MTIAGFTAVRATSWTTYMFRNGHLYENPLIILSKKMWLYDILVLLPATFYLFQLRRNITNSHRAWPCSTAKKISFVYLIIYSWCMNVTPLMKLRRNKMRRNSYISFYMLFTNDWWASFLWFKEFICLGENGYLSRYCGNNIHFVAYISIRKV